MMNRERVKRVSADDAKRLRVESQLVCTAIEGLVAAGMTVLAVSLMRRQPLIEVACSQRCGTLEAVTIRYGAQGVRRWKRKAALFCGCQVEWVEEV